MYDSNRLQPVGSTEAVGRILFARLGDFSPTGIMAVNADGSGLKQLLNWGDTPKSSPDSSRIAFSSGADDSTDLAALDPKTFLHSLKPEFFFSEAGALRMGRGSKPALFLMNSVGTDVRPFASLSDTGFARPVWNPDGGKVAFLGTRRRHTSIWLAEADGSGLRRLTQDDHYSFVTWMDTATVAGVRYASMNSSEPSRITAVDIRTGRTEVLSAFEPGDLDPAWNPDGNRVAFNRGSDMYVMNADGTELRPLGDGMAPVWSPDGEWITFSSRKHNRSGAEVFIIRLDRTGEKRLTDTTPVAEDKIVEDWDPCWVQ